MACRWGRAPDGRWLVVIPEPELLFERAGRGVYSVESRDGRSTDVTVVAVSGPRHDPWTGDTVRWGIPEGTARDRAARLGAISHVRRAPTEVRLTKQRDHVVAPAAVLDQAVTRHGGRLHVDDLNVWVEPGDDWRVWSVDGVRMAKAPIAAAQRATA